MTFENKLDLKEVISNLTNEELITILKVWVEEDEEANVANLKNGFAVEPCVEYNQEAFEDFVMSNSEHPEIKDILEENYEEIKDC